MYSNYFNEQLKNISNRLAVSDMGLKYYLDKNEQPEDVAVEFKERLARLLVQTNWNRYPSNDLSDIEQKVADYCGLKQENIVLSPGSASLITSLLNYFAINRKKIVITQPSYSLFDYHCKTYNIEYTPWMLTRNLEFDLKRLPNLDADSVLIVTAPNNPTGNTLSYIELEGVLKKNKESIIIVDGVYCEFSETDFTPLINKYQNLIMLRSFSKAFPVAGLRLGYLCASDKIAAIVKKLMLQFSINPFTLLFAREILFDAEFMLKAKQRVKTIIAERQRMFQYLSRNFTSDFIKVYPSHGNFLLIKAAETKVFETLMKTFNEAGIKILNTSDFSRLNNTFRVSIGNEKENDAVLFCISRTLRTIEKNSASAADYFGFINLYPKQVNFNPALN